MSYAIIDGNLLEMTDSFDAIIHGCNCLSTMGAGFAKQLATKYPGAELADKVYPLSPIERLGNFSHYHHREDDLLIINAYTQYSYGRTRRHFSYDAFALILQKLLIVDEDSLRACRYGMPMIGAGLGGGDWGLIEQTIKHYADQGLDITVVRYAP